MENKVVVHIVATNSSTAVSRSAGAHYIIICLRKAVSIREAVDEVLCPTTPRSIPHFIPFYDTPSWDISHHSDVDSHVGLALPRFIESTCRTNFCRDVQGDLHYSGRLGTECRRGVLFGVLHGRYYVLQYRPMRFTSFQGGEARVTPARQVNVSNQIARAVR